MVRAPCCHSASSSLLVSGSAFFCFVPKPWPHNLRISESSTWRTWKQDASVSKLTGRAAHAAKSVSVTLVRSKLNHSLVNSALRPMAHACHVCTCCPVVALLSISRNLCKYCWLNVFICHLAGCIFSRTAEKQPATVCLPPPLPL